MAFIKSRSQEIEIPVENPFANDKLERKHLCNILTDVVSFYGQSGCVLALGGEWGSGKTTFVKMWRQHLNNREFKTLYFNAWASDYTEDPLIALIAELSELSADNGTINKIEAGAVRITASVLKSTLKGVLKKATGIDADVISDAIDESIDIGKKYLDKFEEQKTTLEEFKENLRKYIAENAGENPIVFFVDELDRCNPHYAVAVLERIKHLFEIPNIVFVLAVNKKELSNAIQGYYGSSKIDSDEYLRRFIDIDFILLKPKLDAYFDFLYEEYEFDAFFNNETRKEVFGRKDEPYAFKTVALSMCKELNINLRQMDRIFAYSRLALMQFGSRTYLLPDIYFMLCFWKVMDSQFYNQISKKAFTVQEFLMKLEDKLQPAFFRKEEEYYYSSSNMVYVVACLLYCYDITGTGDRPVASTLKAIHNESTKKNEYNIQSKYFEKDELNEALDYYMRRYAEEARNGLRYILNRIELLHSFSK
jgi:hypothetical protein